MSQLKFRIIWLPWCMHFLSLFRLPSVIIFPSTRHSFLLFIALLIKVLSLSSRENWWIIKKYKQKQNPILCGSWSEAFQFCTRCMLSDSLAVALFVLQTIYSQWETNHIIHLYKCAVCFGGGGRIFKVV